MQYCFTNKLWIIIIINKFHYIFAYVYFILFLINTIKGKGFFIFTRSSYFFPLSFLKHIKNPLFYCLYPLFPNPNQISILSLIHSLPSHALSGHHPYIHPTHPLTSPHTLQFPTKKANFRGNTPPPTSSLTLFTPFICPTPHYLLSSCVFPYYLSFKALISIFLPIY